MPKLQRLQLGRSHFTVRPSTPTPKGLMDVTRPMSKSADNGKTSLQLGRTHNTARRYLNHGSNPCLRLEILPSRAELDWLAQG